MNRARSGALLLALTAAFAAAPATAQNATALAQAAVAQPPSGAITALAIERRAGRSELRIVSTSPLQPALSEPFQSAGRTRLFLTLAGATLGVVSPTVDSAATAIAALDAVQREDGVRIAIDATTLDGYGLESAADTTVLWLTQPAAATTATPAARAADPLPSDLQLAGEALRAGWQAFRRDVGRAGHATSDFVRGAGSAAAGLMAGAWVGVDRAVSSTGGWIGANVPFGGIARAIVFIVLLAAPTAGVLLLLRRFRSVPAHAIANAAATAPAPAEGAATAAIAARSELETPSIAADVTPPEPVRTTRAERRFAKAAARAEARSASSAERAGTAQQPASPRVTRTTADARLWAARTLAANGADVGEIARQTGLSREAAGLLIRRHTTAS